MRPPQHLSWMSPLSPRLLRPCFLLVWSFGTESLNSAVFEILRSKRIGSRDIIGHLIAHMPFPIGGPLEPSLYLRPLSRRISAEFAEKTSLAENPPEKNAASRKSAE